MPHYYFHLHNHIGARDEEGQDLPDLESARHEAVRGARDLMAEGMKQGEILERMMGVSASRCPHEPRLVVVGTPLARTQP